MNDLDCNDNENEDDDYNFHNELVINQLYQHHILQKICSHSTTTTVFSLMMVCTSILIIDFISFFNISRVDRFRKDFIN
jgi:hypothetical protein